MNLRPPTEDDLAEIAALFNAVSQEFYGLDGASEQLLRTWFTSPTTDVERNLRLAVADGTIVGYADVDPRSSNPTRCWAEVAIRRTADFDATAAALLEWVEARSLKEPEPALLRTSVLQPDEQMRRALSEHGYSLIRQLRERPSARDIPAAALTAYAHADDRGQAIAAGYQLHVAKPVEPAELVAVVASLAGRS